MNHLTREYVTKLKDSLLFINAVVIIYNASLFLLSFRTENCKSIPEFNTLSASESFAGNVNEPIFISGFTDLI